MKQLILAVLICVAWWMPAQSDEVRNPQIRSVIAGQIEAFKDEDLGRAYGYASDAIHQMFRTPEIFGHMVEKGYPMVYRPVQVMFLELDEEDGALWQKVEIRDKAGRFHILAYEMIDTAQGWKIDGVKYLGKGPGMGA